MSVGTLLLGFRRLETSSVCRAGKRTKFVQLVKSTVNVAEELNSVQLISVVSIAWYVFMHFRGYRYAVCTIKMRTTLEWDA
jgi:hypothetical protein